MSDVVHDSTPPAAAAPDGSGHTHESECLNCGTALAGAFCHKCGQHAHLHRTLGAFAHDLLHGVLHFEGKTWRTLPMLAWRPGDLTRRYIDGERARFVSPLALYLFSVFLMFAVFNSLGGPLPNATTQFQTGMSESMEASRERLGAMERQRQGVAATGRSTGALDAQIATLRGEVSLMEQVEREGLLTGLAHRAVDDLPKGFIRKAVEKFNADPALTLYKLQSNAYKFSWLLIPICVPLVWLLFLWRRRHWRLYDHTVFVTYSLSFQTLLLILVALLRSLGVPLGPMVSVCSIIVALHIYRQFRGAYQLRRFSAFWRMIALTFMVGVAMILFLLAMVALLAT